MKALFNRRSKIDAAEVQELKAKLAAMDRSQAVIEFALDGTILDANKNFLSAMGYTLDEVRGRSHSLFVDPAYAQSAEYRRFWERLNAGEFVAAKFQRFGKGGRPIWIQASYNPVIGADGRPYKVIKFAADVTEAELALQQAERAAEEARNAQQSAIVQSLATGLRKQAQCELDYRIREAFPGEYEQLRLDFNAAMERLEETIVAVRAVCGHVRGGASEISGAAGELSRRTEQQAASLEETAAALDEITATVRRSAEGARQAAQVVSGAKDEALRSGQVADEAVGAMVELKSSSAEIGNIIGVIDEIAFQTNLLALNAGVEAARAGDAGKGFAVVASEVRALAQRSAEAAKEIKGLIAASSSHVARGVQLVGGMGEALKLIVGKVADIDTLVGEIAQSSEEQSTGLNQVNTAINHMDQVVQQNAAMVEEATAAASSLDGEAGELVSLVSQFKVRGFAGDAGQPGLRAIDAQPMRRRA